MADVWVWLGAGVTGLAVAALLCLLSDRWWHSIQEIKRLNTSLADSLAQRERELTQVFESLRMAERQHCLEQERRRMMRDMHDGLGSQLVQTLNMVRNAKGLLSPQQIEPMLQQALDELRLMLDSLEPMDGDLSTVLGTLRLRVGPSLETAGIEWVWAVSETDPVCGLDACGVMHLFRCLQEVLANVVKHARATRLLLKTWQEADRVYLAIEDNGHGSPPWLAQSPRVSGRGLRHIQSRAEQLGAQVRFYALEPGFGVEFTFHTEPGRPNA